MRKSFQSIALFALLALTACSGNKQENQDEVDNRPIVKLASVHARSVSQIQEYTGTIEPEVRNHIAPATPVRIDRIYVEVGNRVSKGQKLVQMDAANLKQLELQLKNQEVEFERIDELYKVGGVSKSEWDAAKMSMDIQKTSYSNLLENTALLSPVNGVVSARNYDNGDLYNGTTPVLTVEQITPVKLFANISESYYDKVSKGESVDVTLDVYPGESFKGVISLIYPTIDAVTRTFVIEVRLENRDQRIRPGMFARATVNYGTEERVVVPDQAIVKQSGAGDRYVYVYKDGKVSYNKVLLGRRMDSEYELLSGVADGDQVVIAGHTSLNNGAEVRVESN